MPKFSLRTFLLIFTCVAAMLAIVCLYVLKVREAARRVNCSYKVRQIVLGMHNYESAYGHLPVGIETSADGTTFRSWRTHLYPSFIESAPQFYDPSLAWDSTSNARLYDGTPVIETDKGGGNPRSVVLDPCPHWCWQCRTASDKRVNYAVVVGDDTAFPLNRPVKFDEITDGLENTILVVETLSGSTKWTEPHDIQFGDIQFGINSVGNKGMASRHPNGINVGFADGAVLFLSDSVSVDDLRALLTIAGNESVTRAELVERGVLQ